MISLQAKRRWIRKHLRKTKITLSQLYIVVLWINFSRIIIEADKIKTSQIYEKNISDFRWRIYFDENKKNKSITTATISFNWNKKKRLKNANIIFMHHDELKNLIMIIKELINRCEKSVDACNKIYKIYFNN